MNVLRLRETYRSVGHAGARHVQRMQGNASPCASFPRWSSAPVVQHAQAARASPGRKDREVFDCQNTWRAYAVVVTWRPALRMMLLAQGSQEILAAKRMETSIRSQSLSGDSEVNDHAQEIARSMTVRLVQSKTL